MTNTLKESIKLRQKLYKFSIASTLLEYEVYGILNTEAGTYYQIRCLTNESECKDAEVLIHVGDENRLTYVSMISDNDESQYIFHIGEESFGKFYPPSYFCLTKKEALSWLYKGFIIQYEEEIKKRKELLKDSENTLCKFKERLKALT